MSKRPSVNYFPKRGGWYTQYKGKQYRLATGPDDFNERGEHGPTYSAALAAFNELMEVADAGERGVMNTVRVVVDLYGQSLEKNDKAKTLEILVQTMTDAMKVFGDLTVAALKPFHVQNWLDSKETWGPTWRDMALRTLITALNWGVKKGYLKSQPITTKNVTVEDKKQGRGKEAYLRPDQWAAIFAQSARNVWFGDLLRFIYGTGCRPAEAYNAQARYYDSVNKCFVYPGSPKPDDYRWKMARKTKKDRRIYVPDDLVPMVEARIERFPNGPIFRTRKGGKWTQQTVSVNMLGYAAKAFADVKGAKPEPTAYGLRHSFCTDWLLGAGSVKVLADLVGTSVAMIDKTYSHLEVDPDRVRKMLRLVMRERTASPCPVGEVPSSASVPSLVRPSSVV